MLTTDDLKGMDEKALTAKLAELRVNLFNLKMQKKTMGLEKPNLLTETKKDIARVLTFQSQNKG
jgi:large subunit ribosomal protein L29